ncbi:hypothetical protein DKT77_11450 [Meridianimarinicoccus roseus]|uniref:Uncharacterized protein n=1 Tax=Meridianimarinicoccus roseus TaxID=2072018 RepID=A0A2V2LGA6_9RHOB|nr:hypothetical protein [Meridianimarinicoccus roseus]PWR02534.1 hypothetical protein DKT77_11450 [Meridianimarinicoccus roseus]
MPHDHGPEHGHHHGPGHNHPKTDHLHSHTKPDDAAADLQVLTAQFIDGFKQAADKSAYLRLAGIPFERPGVGGGTALKLVDVQLTTEWQVGTAAPSFGSRELSYLPYPGEMIRERTNMALVYVSMDEKSLLDIRQFLADRLAGD